MDDLKGEWVKLYYELTNEELLILRRMALIAQSKRGAGWCVQQSMRRWRYTAPLIIGDQRDPARSEPARGRRGTD